jgi:hypothetical protein
MEQLKRMTLVVAVLLLVGLARSPSVQAAQFTSSVCGYSLTYPDTWNAYTPDGGYVVVLRDFSAENSIPESFAPPAGGAVINIQVFPPFDNPAFPQGADDYRVLDWLAAGSTPVARVDPASGQPARVTSILTNARNTDTVIHKGGRVFLLVLTCNADDPQAAAYEQILDSIITSIATIGTPAAFTR